MYRPDSLESDEGAVHEACNHPDLLLEMSRYCCPIKIFYFGFLVL